MMSREFTGKEDQPSELEFVCMEARRLATEPEDCSTEHDSVNEDLTQFELDGEYHAITKESSANNYDFKGQNTRNPLSKLDEASEEDNDDDTDFEEVESNAGMLVCPNPVNKWFAKISKLSTSLKGVGLTERRLSAVPKNVDSVKNSESNSNKNGSQVGNWASANGKLPTSVSFLKLADMGSEIWELFLEKFTELLPEAFGLHKCRATAQRTNQRLGTSCQF
jgi:hypothetical protein